MKITNKATRHYHPFRRLVKRWFLSLIKRNNRTCSNEFNRVMEKLQDTEDAIEVIARQRQVAKWAKTELDG